MWKNATRFERTGGTRIGQRPDGPAIRHANVLSFRRAAGGGNLGGTIATVVHFACHPTCCGALAEASADFCGEARRVVEREEGGHCLYLQGACGDVNPIERKGGLEAAKRMGSAPPRRALSIPVLPISVPSTGLSHPHPLERAPYFSTCDSQRQGSPSGGRHCGPLLSRGC